MYRSTFLLGLILVFFQFFTNVNAQAYRPMAVEGATWIYQTWGDIAPATYVYHISGDTILNGKTYKNVILNGQWFGYLRDDEPNRKVYGGIIGEPVHLLATECDYHYSDGSKEHLIYDFDLSIGQNIEPCDTTYTVAQKIVDDSYKPLHGELLRTLSTDTVFFPNNLIEGIGSYDGIFTDPILKVINAAKGINFITYCVDPNGNCQTSTEEITEASNVSLYPNPASELLSISTEGTISSSKIYDLNGRLLITQQSSGHSINISHLAAGIYILDLALENKKYYKARFVKL